MRRNELVRYLDEYLSIGLFSSLDPSLNSLVVGGSDKEVSKIAFAVDACQRTFDLAHQWGADMLIVHHGLYWGSPLAVTGAHYSRIKTLLDGNVDLYVAHLPLDAHPSVGNNAVMASLLGLVGVQPFAQFKAVEIGCKGNLPKPLTAQEIATQLGFTKPIILPFGSTLISSVGIVSGGASDDVHTALSEGLDCFITGECEHQIYNDCLEQGITMIGGGHYESEVFGVQALAEHLSTVFGVQVLFLDNPTGL
ncbi:MAG TPA: Nif3-like dinuclear metal center hexameric protein [Sphaerochaeta sp.]|jgi:dinuclear metal center YbgI/SA1388 family protein|nr:Nif3-like dinuclear metal center hexameric protein [Sphaerochaeta sp.]